MSYITVNWQRIAQDTSSGNRPKMTAGKGPNMSFSYAKHQIHGLNNYLKLAAELILNSADITSANQALKILQKSADSIHSLSAGMGKPCDWLAAEGKEDDWINIFSGPKRNQDKWKSLSNRYIPLNWANETLENMTISKGSDTTTSNGPKTAVGKLAPAVTTLKRNNGGGNKAEGMEFEKGHEGEEAVSLTQRIDNDGEIGTERQVTPVSDDYETLGSDDNVRKNGAEEQKNGDDVVFVETGNVEKNGAEKEKNGDDVVMLATGIVRKNGGEKEKNGDDGMSCLLYTSPSPRDQRGSRMPSSA